jgi:hypothetical protein
MKKQALISIAIILVTAGLSFQQLTAQEKTKAEQEKELKILKEIDQQKKELAEQQKAQAEAKAAFDIQQAVEVNDDMLKDINVDIEAAKNSGDAIRYFNRRSNRPFPGEDAFVFANPGIEFYGHSTGDDAQRTTWDYSRSVIETTFSKEFTFDVEKKVNSLIMSIMGDCKAGDIHIKIVMPNGKSYSEIVIDEFGDLNWRKSFNISETENQDKTGEWKYIVSSNKATGFFKISLQTY